MFFIKINILNTLPFLVDSVSDHYSLRHHINAVWPVNAEWQARDLCPGTNVSTALVNCYQWWNFPQWKGSATELPQKLNAATFKCCSLFCICFFFKYTVLPRTLHIIQI